MQKKKIQTRNWEIDLLWGGWTFTCLRKILSFGKDIGASGVVVHCGNCCGKDYDESVRIMWKSVIACSNFASEECKLIIETSAGESGEVLSKPDELSYFYLSLPDEIKNKIGICVDTCHVFAAGNYPHKFIDVLMENEVPITLIHYNDSKDQFNSKKDRHASVSQGWIGYKSMNKVLEICIENNIPLLFE